MMIIGMTEFQYWTKHTITSQLF